MTDADPTPQEWPGVSVVVPVLDEQEHLRAAVSTMLGQDYPGPMEVLLALGPSRDRTDEIAAELAADHARLRLFPNPTRATGAGLHRAGRSPTAPGAGGSALSRAVAAARHDVVVRLDGHALVPPDYVRVAIETLQR